MSIELEFKVASFRKIPSPYFSEGDNSPEMYTLICDVKEVPKNIPMQTNPREQNLNTNVAKKIKDSLLDPGQKDFYLLNRGLLLSADKVIYDNTSNKVKVSFTDLDIHGDVDGGHTYKIIQENSDMLEPNQQFVKIEILTNVGEMFESLAAARNTSVQVTDQSIAELEKRFEPIKDVFQNESFFNDIAYKQNAEGKIDISTILAIFNAFNIDRYVGTKEYPINSYSSNKACVNIYINESKKHEIDPENNPYVKMEPIMIDIIKLYDKLEVNMPTYYKNETGNGRYGAITGIVTRQQGKPAFRSKFYNKSMEYLTPISFIYPILGAFRALVSVDESTGLYTWHKNIDPLKVLDDIGSELVSNTINMSRNLGNNPNATGKSRNLWHTLYLTVKMQIMELS